VEYNAQVHTEKSQPQPAWLREIDRGVQKEIDTFDEIDLPYDGSNRSVRAVNGEESTTARPA
jgi:hypothetical protein